MHIEDNFLIVDEIFEPRKIYGHSFVGLCGLDPLSKIGDTLLKMHKLIKEDVPKKYLLRGDFAEKIIKHVYERDGHKCTTYNKYEIKFDNFKELKYFGGLIDIELLEEKTLIEVKSKSMKDYEYVKASPPKQEVYQGLYYGFLRRYDTITMEWVFFDEETEQEVFEGKKPTTLKNLKKHSEIIPINYIEMNNLLTQALKLNKAFEENKKISLNLISDEVLNQLGLKRPNYDFGDGLPF